MSKVALAFVVLGFFLPILRIPLVGSVSGVDLVQFLTEFKETKYIAAILFIPVFAFVSIGVYLVTLRLGKTGNPVCVAVDFCVLAGTLVYLIFSMISSMKDMSESVTEIATAIFREILSVDAYMIVLGWIASFVLLIMHIGIDGAGTVCVHVAIAIGELKKRIDALPFVVQFFIGLFMLALIVAAGFLLLWIIDMLLVVDPIGRVLFGYA